MRSFFVGNWTMTLDSADMQSVMQLLPGADKARRVNARLYRIVVWSASEDDWESSVQIQIATPLMKEAGVWLSPDDLRFTANRVTSFEGGFHVRAIATGTLPEDLKVEFV